MIMHQVPQLQVNYGVDSNIIVNNIILLLGVNPWKLKKVFKFEILIFIYYYLLLMHLNAI